ncbi:MAG: hypothetical protein NTU62_03185 [Spirochaetes bacterium]|nr:hypothetical protein [Spirochaetota bacterium]
MNEPSPREMLEWISETYEMGPDALARMFQRNRRTINAWMHEGRISVANGTRIRSSFYYLTNRRPQALPDCIAVDSFMP